MDASPVVVTQHHYLGTSMPSGGVHTIKAGAGRYLPLPEPFKGAILARSLPGIWRMSVEISK